MTTISNYIKQVASVVSGSDHVLFFAKRADITAHSFDGSEIDGITGGDAFKIVEVDIDKVHYTAEGEGGSGFMSEQSLIMTFSKKSANLVKLVKELTDGVVSGLVAIRKDRHGDYWVSGLAPAAKVAQNRPWMGIEVNFDSGEKLENWEEGNKYIITLKRTSATEEYPLDTAQKAAMVGKTAAYVDWPE